MVFPEEKSQSNDDPPYFTETYPGKVCCLCNLGERSALGQGDLIQIENIGILNEGIDISDDEKRWPCETLKVVETVQSACRRIKNRCRGFNQNECMNELEKVGQIEILSLRSLMDGNYFYVHRMCIKWSLGYGEKDLDSINDVVQSISKSLKRKCTYCGQYGASVLCKTPCTKAFHFPCAAASGCFLLIENYTAFCRDHLNEGAYISKQYNIVCHQCSNLGDISKLIMCSTCGDHYHTTCIGLTNLPDSKSGWNCLNCNKCQICRQMDSSEGRSVKCEQCQKVYHASCLRPIISSIPKYGWKCNRCRVCTDCGSRTPGAGTSSRWHCHYTICDSCYQQRNKGFSCPICHRAYRAAAYKEMVKCNRCNRFVHSSCDEEADLSIYHKKKEYNPDYDYICPNCKVVNCEKSSNDIFEYTTNNLFVDASLKNENDFAADNVRKRTSVKEIQRSRSGKLILQKPGILTQFGRKRNARGKTRPSTANNQSGNDLIERYNNDLAKKMLICSVKDKYILYKDICVMCGSVGADQESCLISCVQCGQCYHPYCVNVKISKVLLQKGWRCLDCTVCEGCGQKNDEGRLILCDECDISYHIYCMNPPLETVPHGHWRCKWCAVCHKCGRTSPGINSTWQNSYLECGPCASEQNCSVCFQRYHDNDLIIQCVNCERWLHCICDSISSEEEAKFCDNNDYFCGSCRPKGKSFLHFLSMKNSAKDGNSAHSNLCSSHHVNSYGKMVTTAVTMQPNDINEGHDTTHWIDGVCVSERGLNAIKALTSEIKRKRKLKPTDIHNKETGILASIESVVSGTLDENDGEENLLSKKSSETYKDGMIWSGPDNNPPSGFSISTNEDGINILRKKRQRNLQKLGIGGFSVRNRTLKKENDDNPINKSEKLSPVLSDKKKKIVRKKIKNKLSETYPIYLQEAFFGKCLLDPDKPVSALNKLDSCEENEFDDSTDEFKIVKQEYCQKDDQVSQDKSELLLSNIQQTHKKQILKNQFDEEITPIINNQIIPQTSTADNIKIVKIFGQSETPNILPQNTNASKQDCVRQYDINRNAETLSGQIDQFSETKISHFQMHQETQNMGKLNKICSDIDPKVVIDTSTASVQNINQTVPHRLQNSVHLQYQPPVAKNFDNFAATKHTKLQIPQNAFAQHSAPAKCTSGSIAAMKTSEDTFDSIVAGTQKTAEKMRRDEDLGDMATISAVLYSNTQHPELKQIFPNWNDRCKQILKRWRSLPTERKAPFLQHAKDNRSALRMRRAQQDQEKLSFQQKTLKEQEQERIWKQHQAKAKENQNSIYLCESSSNAASDQDKHSGFLDNNRHIFNNNSQDAGQSSFCNKAVYGTNTLVQANQFIQQINPRNKEHKKANIDTENKHLRTLLLKHGASWIDDGNDNSASQVEMNQFKLEAQNENNASRVNNEAQVISNNSKNLSNSQNIPQTQLSVNVLKHEPKNRADSKLSDVSDTTTELDKFEQYASAGITDILGGLGEGDDDDLLKSLTAEIGDDFNILEYADPEYADPNLLNNLDFVDAEKLT